MIQTSFPESKYFTCAFVVFLLMTMTACVNKIEDDETTTAPAELKVTTRSSSSIPYPVQLYAFSPDTREMLAQATIESKDNDTPLLQLPKGNYRLVALAGTADCKLPDTPSLDGLISLPGSYYTREALMRGSADVTINDKDAQADITMSNCMASISLTLADIPTKTQAVSMRISPLYSAMSFAGDYSKENATATVECSKQDNDWKTPTFYIFPGSGRQQVLSIELTDDKGKTQTYGYTYNGTLAANTPYNLSGSYKQDFSVNGSISAEGWNTPEDIDFVFGSGDGGTGGNEGDEGDSGEGDGGDRDDTAGEDEFFVDKLPSTRSIWNGHFVAYADKAADGRSAEVVLLSLEEWTDVPSANSEDGDPDTAKKLAAAYTEHGMTGWYIPLDAEAKNIMANCGGTLLAQANKAIDQAGGTALTGSGKDDNNNDVRYLCRDGKSSFSLKSTSGSQSSAGSARTYYLRAAKSVHLILRSN